MIEETGSRDRQLKTEAGWKIAFDRLRSAILNGDMSGGQRLVETELAEQFEVSRAAVRAALVGLESEGIVERIPNRGARVRSVSSAEAVTVTECRMVLEGLCARRAAERATDEDISELREVGSEMAEAVRLGEPMTYSDLNNRMHAVVRQLAAQPVAADLLERLNGQMARHHFRLALLPGRPAQSLPQHLAIIEAIAAHDPDDAESAMREHLRSVMDVMESVEAARTTIGS